MSATAVTAATAVMGLANSIADRRAEKKRQKRLEQYNIRQKNKEAYLNSPVIQKSRMKASGYNPNLITPNPSDYSAGNMAVPPTDMGQTSEMLSAGQGVANAINTDKQTDIAQQTADAQSKLQDLQSRALAQTIITSPTLVRNYVDSLPDKYLIFNRASSKLGTSDRYLAYNSAGSGAMLEPVIAADGDVNTRHATTVRKTLAQLRREGFPIDKILSKFPNAKDYTDESEFYMLPLPFENQDFRDELANVIQGKTIIQGQQDAEQTIEGKKQDNRQKSVFNQDYAQRLGNELNTALLTYQNLLSTSPHSRKEAKSRAELMEFQSELSKVGLTPSDNVDLRQMYAQIEIAQNLGFLDKILNVSGRIKGIKKLSELEQRQILFSILSDAKMLFSAFQNKMPLRNLFRDKK